MRLIFKERWLPILLTTCLASDVMAITAFLAERREHQERHIQSSSPTPQRPEAQHFSSARTQPLSPLTVGDAHAAIDQRMKIGRR